MKKRISAKKLIYSALTILILVALYPILAVTVNEALILAGYKKTPVPVVGTGSMYPSLYWEVSEGGPEDPSNTTLSEERTTPLMYKYVKEISILGNVYSLRVVNRGDMVAFKNEKTAQILESDGKDPTSGFIKRVIAIPGDKVVVKDGFVFINGEEIEEPYIYKPRSTYGGELLPDCQEIEIPNDNYLVMGDNRKASTDSRHALGLISIDDINYILPFSEQEVYRELWRDTSKDSLLASQPTLAKDEFVKLVNDYRANKNLSPLKLNYLLSSSSKLRAEVVLDTNDFSTEATRSGYSAQDAMTDIGYSNIVTGEFIAQGYYTADELFNNLIYFNETKSSMEDEDYDDIGISVINGSINSCPTQVIVGHLGGYIPPNYNTETINSWKSLREDLDRVIPSWEKVKEYSGIDQSMLNELLNLLSIRRSLADEVYNAMISGVWLTDDQLARIEEDSSIAKRANEIINSINP